MTTIRDVAQVAGVSVATVSRVLNSPQSVRHETRQRVLRIIDELNYRPDPTARRLSMGRTFTIRVILPYLTRPAFVERLRGVEAALSHSAYDLVVVSAETQAKRDAHYEMMARERRFDGTIVMALAPTDEEAAAIVEAHVPVVLVDAVHPLLPSVGADDEAGGRLAAEHLLDKGHRRLACLGDVSHELPFHSSRARLAGFSQRLAQAGVPLREPDQFLIPYSRREARAVLDRLWDRPAPERPTAIFATTDTVALGLLDGLRLRGLSAPDDLAVIGFNDLDVAELYDLTTIHQPLFQSGARGVERLLTWLESGDPPTPTRLQLPLTLVERGTT